MKHQSVFTLTLITIFLFTFGCQPKQSQPVNSAADNVVQTETEELPEPEGPHPHLSIADSVYMGVVTTDDPVKTVTIEMSNTGDETLYVTGAFPECDCTTVAIKDSVLAPGSKGYVEATVNLSKYGSGRVENRFFLVNNNLARHYVYVTLVADKE